MDASFVAEDRFDLSLLPDGPADAPGPELEERIMRTLQADGFIEGKTRPSLPRWSWAWVVILIAAVAAAAGGVALLVSELSSGGSSGGSSAGEALPGDPDGSLEGREGRVPATSANRPASDDKNATVSPADLQREFALPNELTPTGELILEGQVLDPDGLPVAGAKVTLNSIPTRSTLSDPSGLFSFGGLAEGVHWVFARRGSLVGGAIGFDLDADSRPLVLRMRAGTEVQFLIADASSGDPVKGARIELRDGAVRNEFSDQAGSAVFTGVAGPNGEVAISAAGYARHFELIPVPASSPNPIQIRVELGRGANVSGTVVDADGRGVPGARVLAKAVSRRAALSPLRRSAVFTDAQGRFTFDALTPDLYRFTGEHPDHATGVSRSRRIEAGRPVDDIRVQLGAATRMTGAVLDAAGGPVPFAYVRYAPAKQAGGGMLNRSKGGTVASTHADARGEFEFTGVPLAQLQVVAMDTSRFSEPIAVDTRPGVPVIGLRLVLSGGGRIAGRVVDAQGAPVPDVAVAVRAWSEGQTLQRARLLKPYSETLTDGGGGFAFDGLVEGTYTIAASWSPGQVNFHFESPTTVKTGDEDVNLTLSQPGGLEGRVVFADGSSPGRFQVAFKYQNSYYPFADPEGRFSIQPIDAGEVELTISGDSFATLAGISAMVRPGEVTDLGEIQVCPGRTIHGRVLGPQGQPVAGARVVCGSSLSSDGTSLIPRWNQRRYPEQQHQTRSDVDGRYRIVGLGPAGGVVMAEHGDLGRSLPVKIGPGEDIRQVDLTLVAFGSLEGRVTNNSKPEPVALVFVTHKDRPGHDVEVMTDSDGRYVITRLAAGQRVVYAKPLWLQGGAASKQVTVRPGEQVVVDFDLEYGQGVLRLTVQPLPGSDLSRTWVWMFPGQALASDGAQLKAALARVESKQMNQCDPGKACEFRNLLPGDYSLCAMPFSGDMDDPVLFAKVRAAFDQLQVICQLQRITSDEEPHTAVMNLPGMDPSVLE